MLVFNNISFKNLEYIYILRMKNLENIMLKAMKNENKGKLTVIWC